MNHLKLQIHESDRRKMKQALPKRIWAFWEPKTAIPGYIQLCLKTWRLGLPDSELVVLDYENLGEYLTQEEQDAALLRHLLVM